MLKIDISNEDLDRLVNKSVQGAVKSALANINVKDVLSESLTPKINRFLNKSIQDGTFINQVAKHMSKEVNLEPLYEKLDIENLRESIIERASNKVANDILKRLKGE